MPNHDGSAPEAAHWTDGHTSKEIISLAGSREFSRLGEGLGADTIALCDQLLDAKTETGANMVRGADRQFLVNLKDKARHGQQPSPDAAARLERIAADHPPKEKSRPGQGGSSVVQKVRPASFTSVTDTRQQHVEAVHGAFAVIDNAECNLVEAYIIAGESLVQAKAAGSHGTWLVWLSENFQRSDDSAERAMRFWHHRDELRKESARVRNFSVRKALEFLAQQKKQEVLPAPSSRRRPVPVSKRALQNKVKYLEEKLELKQAALEVANEKLAEIAKPEPTVIASIEPAPYIPPAPTMPLLPAEQRVDQQVDVPVEASVEQLSAHNQANEMMVAWEAACEPARAAFLARIGEAQEIPAETAATEIEADERDRKYGPLSGWEWLQLGECCYRRATGRGRHKRPGHYSSEFLKLVLRFNVPLKALEAAE